MIQMHPDTYRVSGAPMNRETRLFAACLWSGNGYLSHVSAGQLWELEGLPHQDEIELTCHVGKRSPDGIMVYRRPVQDRPPLRTVRCLPVTSVERTIFDLVSKLKFRAGLPMDDALRKGLTTIDRLWEAWETFGAKGRKGTKIMKVLLFGREGRDGLLKSRLEAKMLRILKRMQLPAVPNYRIADGARVGYLDFAFPEWKIGVETHGAVWHHGEERWKKDIVRDRWLKLLGWNVLYFSWDDVHLTPHQVESDIRSFLRGVRSAS